MNILPKPSGCKLCSYLRLPSCETPVPGSSRNRAFSSRMCERLQPVRALQHFQMTEAANGIPVACLPMVFHGTTRELVVLGSALVIGRPLGELDDVADFIVSLRLQYFHIPCGSIYDRSWFQDLAVFMLEFFFSPRLPANPSRVASLPEGTSAAKPVEYDWTEGQQVP